MTDYNRPTELIDATKATFLISDLVQSPMGANLSGFQAADDALSVTNEADGQLYNWIEIQALFRNN
ncbi:MAG: nitrous oxide reductase accessory protein NosL, partial [Flavobacteriaceae bacterium]|nr:nitrous oxide reductase accessory protein NosL [Flavobacteriaceae bacterium]